MLYFVILVFFTSGVAIALTLFAISTRAFDVVKIQLAPPFEVPQ
jgi:hypothetical protein